MKFGELKESKIYRFQANRYTIKNGGLFCLDFNDYSDYSMYQIMLIDFTEEVLTNG